MALDQEEAAVTQATVSQTARKGEPNGKGKVAILSLTQSLAHGYRSELMNRAPNYVHSGDMEEVGDPAVAP